MNKTLRLLILFTISTTLLISTQSVAETNDAPTSAGPPDRRFGAVETYDAPAAATELGAGWTRVPFLWSQMQPTGTHEWFPPISDEALAGEISQGRQPVGLVITTPNWATDTSIGAGLPVGLHSGHNDPGNHWATFLRRLVTTYAGRIDHWIVWNEPDVWDAAHPGHTWGGSVEDFLQLQRVSYATIKETNPGATVILAGTSYWWDAAYGRDLYFRRYLDALVQDGNALGNNYYCDAVALHVYFQPDFVYSITALYHSLMREHGFDKPLWLVETNAAPSLDPHMPAPGGRFAITLEEQAAYIVQAFAMGIAGGASRISVFKMIDTPTDLSANPEPFGLVRADGSRRPAFNAYRVAATYLAGFQGGQLEQRPDVSIVTVPRASGSTTVLWTRTPSPATVQVGAHAASATLVDMWGNRRAISASDGFYTVQLPGATCTHNSPCIIGGPPMMIVEGPADAAPPAPASPATTSGDDGAKPAYVPPTPMPTPQPAYAVSLRPIEIKGARDVWHKRGLPGYQIELIAGPPYYLYQLTIVDERITQARRSSEPLNVNTDDIDKLQGSPLATMTTIYNRRTLTPYTVEGLFDQVTDYYEQRPPCDTEVTANLNGDWAFPRQIIESLADDCPTDTVPSLVEVVAFATLTPTPTITPTPSPQPTATTTAMPTATALPSSSPSPPASPTLSPSPTTSGGLFPTWLALAAGAVIIGALLIRRNGKRVKRET